MNFALKAWLPLLGVLAAVKFAYLIVMWGGLSTTHKLSFMVATVIVLHMFEEERYPGGFGYLFNVVRARSDVPDRFPMNPMIAMVVDVAAYFILFVPALFFPQLIWLGMAPMFLAIMELTSHSVLGLMQRRSRGLPIYNPGLVTAAALAGIGVSYIAVATSNGSMAGVDWLWAALYFVGSVLVCVMVPEYGLRSRTARWAYEGEHLLGDYYRRYTTLEEAFGNGTAKASETTSAR